MICGTTIAAATSMAASPTRSSRRTGTDLGGGSGPRLVPGHQDEAVAAFREAVGFDATYSAAWKMLGRALVDSGDSSGAVHAFERGIVVARARGDEQAAKEMTVFLRRLHNSATN